MTPLSGCPRVEIACRRACRSPRLASVISFSTSGLTALAFASVVLMRSWSMTSTQRLASSALRCEALRDSLWRGFLGGIGPAAPPVVAKVEPALVERLDDLVDRLLAEVRDRGQLALGLGDQVADGLDAGPLEAVVGPHAELELLDEDVVHRAAAGAPAGRRDGARARAARAVVERGDARRARAQLLDAVLVGEDRQGGDEDLRRVAQRRLGIDRAVRLDVERELVVVRALADARALDVVGHAPHGREDRVDGDDADRLVGRLVVLRRAVAAAAADREVELELGLLLERGDVRVRVEDLDARGQVDVARGDVAGTGDDERRLDLRGVRVHAAHDALEVEDDVRHVLGDALDRRELVRHPLDADRGHGGTGQRRQQHAAQRVAERVAEAAVERLDREGAAVVLDRLGGDSGDLEVEHQGPNVVGGWSGPGAGTAGELGPGHWERRLLRVQLDDELLLHGRRDLATLGLAQHLRRQRVVVGLQPRRDLCGQLRRVADDAVGALAAGPHRDHVVVAHLIARDVHAAAVDGPVAVADHLARLAARGGEAQAHEHVVEAALEDAQQVLARDAGLPRGLGVVGAELRLQHAVVAAGLLLLPQLYAVLRLLLTPAAVLAGRVRAALDAALVGQAALALEEELLPFAAALLALRGGVSSHLVLRVLRRGAACGGGSRCALAG